MTTTVLTVLWWAAIAVLVISMARRGGCGRTGHRRPRASPVHIPVDPVCRMELEPAEIEATRSANGETYAFCSQTCVEAFDKSPTMYAGPSGEHRKHRHHAGC